MAASNAMSGYGTAVYYHAATTSAPSPASGWESISFSTLISEIQEVELPASEVESIDVTHSLSPNGFKESIPALKDAGSLSGTANLIPSEYSTFMSSVCGTSIGWKILLTSTGAADDSGTPALAVYFMGTLSLGNASVPHDGKVSVPFSLKVDSAPHTQTSFS